MKRIVFVLLLATVLLGAAAVAWPPCPWEGYDKCPSSTEWTIYRGTRDKLPQSARWTKVGFSDWYLVPVDQR